MYPMTWRRSPHLILACAVVVLLLAMGVRATFGLFMQPMGMARGWSREVFSFAFAIQNIVWGLAAPLLGALADRHGSGRTIALGALFYALGLVGTAYATTPAMLYLASGLLVGIGQAGTTFGVVLGVVGRAFAPAQRSAALGLASAGGSLGQFVMMPVGGALIAAFDWQASLWWMAGLSLVAALMAAMLTGKPAASGAHGDLRLGDAFREALRDRSFHLLFWSFFVCGFHTAFITLHLPSFVVDQGLNFKHGAMAVATIGLFNVIGSWGAGWLGGRRSKRALLTWLYVLRAGSIAILLAFPLTPLTLYLFAATMGLLWLGTVPLTNGLVGEIYGMRYVSTLYGLIFLGHQVGSFVGAWLGGWAYEHTGSYDLMWWLGIGLALAAGAVTRPVDERPIGQRGAPQAALGPVVAASVREP